MACAATYTAGLGGSTELLAGYQSIVDWGQPFTISFEIQTAECCGLEYKLLVGKDTAEN